MVRCQAWNSQAESVPVGDGDGMGRQRQRRSIRLAPSAARPSSSKLAHEPRDFATLCCDPHTNCRLAKNFYHYLLSPGP